MKRVVILVFIAYVGLLLAPTGVIADVDLEPPSCQRTAINPGPPVSIEVIVQDGESGLEIINVTIANNSMVTIPPFATGTNDPVVVSAEKIIQTAAAKIELEIFDVAGNSTVCDYTFEETADIDIEKLTNGVDSDDPNAGDAPQIMPGELVTWTYKVTNTGEVTLQNLEVVDNQTGVMPICPMDILEPGQTMVCTASAPAENLDFTSSTTVPGLCGDVPQRPLYENKGRATGQTDAGEYVEDEDPSHYCNPQDEDEDGIPDDQDECPDTVIPEWVPTKRLGTNRFALVDGDTIFDTKKPNGNGPRKAFTIEDTSGCSCEQIIEELGLGKGHVKFGCSISAIEEWIDAVNP